MKTIICPTDFSACAENATTYAHELAILLHSRLVLLHSTYVPDLMDYRGWHVNTKAAYTTERFTQDKLVSICQTMENKNPDAQITYETRLDYRPTAEAIVHAAEAEKADLIVMGTSGARGLKEIVAGSTSADVMEKSTCPVLIVPQASTFQPIRRMVVATDLTQDYTSGLSLVITLAELFEAEIMFLHVLQEANPLRKEMAKAAYSHTYSFLDYVHTSFHTQENADIEKGILAFNQHVQGDLIVMINHKKNFWQDLFSKPHTRTMTYHSPTPVLAIHT